MANKYKLKLTKLDFVSPVDVPAQETARVLLMKRGGDLEMPFAEVKKLSDELGLVFCWAFTSKVAGADYHDLQGDAIDPDFMSACAAFMDGARAVDTMHDGVQKGSVTFGMPMTPEIAKAFFGIEVDTVGFMVAIRPSPEDYAKFKSGKFTGVSIAGMGERTPLAKRGVAKMSVLTDAVDGHQHALDCCDPADEWCGDRLSTTFQLSEGATEPHSHAWIFDETTGAITIALDSGHTHAVSAVVPTDVIAAYLADETADAAEMAAPVEPDDTEPARETTITVIAARAPRNSTRPTPAQKVKTMPNANTDADKIAELTKRAGLIRNLSTTEHALWKSLDGEAAEEFIAKSVADRAPMIAEFAKADDVIYKAIDGTTYTKARADLARLHKMADDERTLRLDGEFAKRAGEMFASVKCDDNSHVDLLKAIDGIADGTKREAVMKTVTMLVATSRLGKSAAGIGGSSTPAVSAPATELDTLIAKHAVDNKISISKATNAVLDTPEGARLYAAIPVPRA